MLDMSFSQIKDDFSGFRDGVAADVAQAVSGAADKIRVHTVQAGSLILDLHMMPDVCAARRRVSCRLRRISKHKSMTRHLC